MVEHTHQGNPQVWDAPTARAEAKPLAWEMLSPGLGAAREADVTPFHQLMVTESVLVITHPSTLSSTSLLVIKATFFSGVGRTDCAPWTQLASLQFGLDAAFSD